MGNLMKNNHAEGKFITEDEIAKLKGADSEQVWSHVIDSMIKRCGGYPADYYEKIVLSGIKEEVDARLGVGMEITEEVERR